MEEEKNRRNKRTKKKKNKQSARPTESANHEARESASNGQSNVLGRGEDNNSNHQVSRATNKLDDVGECVDADKDGTIANCSEGKNVASMKEHFTLDRETSFLEKIKELQTEKDAHTNKEAVLEEKIKQLLKEKDENDQKEASQKVKIQKLQDEKYASVMNETSLKEKLMQLEKEKKTLIQKVDNLEHKSEHLLWEMDAYLQKEAGLQTNIQHMEAEKNLRIQKEGNLQEKIKQMESERDSWILKENSTKEPIANLTNDEAQLQAQVIELEQARLTLSEEQKQLKEIISALRLQIINLESSAGLLLSSMDNKVAPEEEMNYKIEAAHSLVEKLIAENSELVEKVNELNAEHELDERGLRRTEHFTPAGSVHGALNASPSASMPSLDIGADERHGTAQATDSISQASCKMMPISGSNQSLEDAMVVDKRNGEHVNLSDGYGVGITTSEKMEGDEIVQITSNENAVVVKGSEPEPEPELAENDENGNDVPLTDAPLIGAPFRLLSVVARYVSGADLVNKNGGRRG